MPKFGLLQYHVIHYYLVAPLWLHSTLLLLNITYVDCKYPTWYRQTYSVMPLNPKIYTYHYAILIETRDWQLLYQLILDGINFAFEWFVKCQ